MPSRDPRQRFEDIAENIRRIEEHVVGFNEDSFLDNLKTYDAVERCLERVSEAGRNLEMEATE